MFGAEIWRHDLNANKRYFDVVGVFYTYTPASTYATVTNVALVPCTIEHWSQFPEVINKYGKLQISYWLCPPINYTFDLYGKYSSDNSQQFGIEIYPCNNATDPSRPCATQA